MLETSIVTLKGRLFDYLSPDPIAIDIEEIAHVLAGTFRFRCHTGKYYTVAQHVCCVCDLVKDPFKAQALHHDTHEVWTGDIPRPLKRLLGDRIREVELRIDAAVFGEFGIIRSVESDAAVKAADDMMQAIEFRDLKVNGDYWRQRYGLPVPLPGVTVKPLSIEDSSVHFLITSKSIAGESWVEF